MHKECNLTLLIIRKKQALKDAKIQELNEQQKSICKESRRRSRCKLLKRNQEQEASERQGKVFKRTDAKGSEQSVDFLLNFVQGSTALPLQSELPQ